MHPIRLLVCVILVVRCSDRAPRQDPPALPSVPPAAEAVIPPPMSQPGPEVRDSILRLLEQRVLRLGHTRSALQGSLGSPLSVDLAAAEGPDGYLDTLITVRYAGLRIDLRKTGQDQEEYFSNIRAVDTAFALPAGLRLFNTTDDDIDRLLGTPARVRMISDTTVLSFEVPMGPIIQFYVQHDVLVLVRWVYELG